MPTKQIPGLPALDEAPQDDDCFVRYPLADQILDADDPTEIDVSDDKHWPDTEEVE